VETTRARLELGVLSTMIQYDNEGVARAALEGARCLFHVDEELATLYNDTIMAALSNRLRARLEEEMRPEGHPYRSEFARKHIAQGREQGREEGREEGRAEEAASRPSCLYSKRGRWPCRTTCVPASKRATTRTCSNDGSSEPSR